MQVEGTSRVVTRYAEPIVLEAGDTLEVTIFPSTPTKVVLWQERVTYSYKHVGRTIVFTHKFETFENGNHINTGVFNETH